MQKINRQVHVHVLPDEILIGILKEIDTGGCILNVIESQKENAETSGPAFNAGLRYVPNHQIKLIRYTEHLPADDVEDDTIGAYFKYMGTWDAAFSYTPGQAVTKNGQGYVCLLGNTNKDPATEVVFWDIFSAKGLTTQIVQVTLSAGDIVNQYIDLAHTAYVNSIQLIPQGGVEQEEDVDYTVGYTAGAGGTTRITFIGDLATGGLLELVADDILNITYQTG
jgi:hypothetical protein